MTIEPELILEDLKADKSPRTQASLDKLNELLKNLYEAGSNDYSIVTIGKLSKEQGGVGIVSIRNKSGEHYRRLIEAWASKANTTMKKPPVPHSRQREISCDEKLLRKLDDPVLKTLFGQIIAERNKLRNENRVLKQLEHINIDQRSKRVLAPAEAMPSFNGLLYPFEIDSLKKAISDSFMKRHFWTVDEKYASVKDENGRVLYDPGYVSAIKKVLDHVLTPQCLGDDQKHEIQIKE